MTRQISNQWLIESIVDILAHHNDQSFLYQKNASKIQDINMHPNLPNGWVYPFWSGIVSNRYPYCNLYTQQTITLLVCTSIVNSLMSLQHTVRICTVWFIQCFISCNVISYKWNKPHASSINSSRVWQLASSLPHICSASIKRFFPSSL
jgi:hypothetical protein